MRCFALMLSTLCIAAQAKDAAAPNAIDRVQTAIEDPANLLLLDVMVERISVAGAMNAYQVGDAVFVPMAELARVLTLLVQVDTTTRRAKGFLLSTENTFDLDVDARRVFIAGKESTFDAQRLTAQSDDIYVDTRLIETWWPVQLKVDLSKLQLLVKPKESLPLQLRLARERAARSMNLDSSTGTSISRSFPKLIIPYERFSLPSIDQTVSLYAGGSSAGVSNWATSSSTFLNGDLFGLEASGFVYLGSTNAAPVDRKLRLTLGRSDNSGLLFGRLPATTAQVGNVLLPGVDHITRSSATGNGILLSNVPLSRPQTYGVTSFKGALQPGWDVELYFNDALVGYQQSRPDGTYSFEDQTLIFGENRYRLVFHGPQGQLRVESKTFQLDASTVRPGEFLYTVGSQRDDQGFDRQQVHVEYGLTSEIAAHGGFHISGPTVRRPQREYLSGGLRSFVNGWSVDADGIWCLPCSRGLVSMGLHRRLTYGSLRLTQLYLRDFESDLYPQTDKVIDASTQGRIDLSLPLAPKRRLPLTLQFRTFQLRNGLTDHQTTVRVTQSLLGATVTQEVLHERQDGVRAVSGNLQLSRTVAGASTRAQLNHTLHPTVRAQVGSIVTDMSLPAGIRMNTAVTHVFRNRDTTLSVNLNRSFGAFSLRAGFTRNSTRSISGSIQVFTSVARDSRADRWHFGAIPLGSSGAASVRTFLDKNLNNRFDEGDEAIEGATFRVNGSTSPVKSDAAGYAYLARLPSHRQVSVEVNPGSLEDSQWSPLIPGVTLLPRPGRSASLDFAVIVTADIDGFVYLERNGQQRGVSDVVLQLYDARGEVVSSVRSIGDGYYIFTGVRPGRYKIGVAPDLIERLGLEPVDPQPVEILSDGSFVDAVDFVLRSLDDEDEPDQESPPRER
jgi:hypothetical protein